MNQSKISITAALAAAQPKPDKPRKGEPAPPMTMVKGERQPRDVKEPPKPQLR